MLPACSLITLLPNVIRSADKSSLRAGALQGSLLPPATAPPARAIVQAPSTIGSCDALSLFGSSSEGQAGRALVYSWELSSVSGSNDPTVVNTITAAVAELVRSRPRFDVPAATLQGGLTYFFKLTVSNWLGSSNSQTVQVQEPVNTASRFTECCFNAD